MAPLVTKRLINTEDYYKMAETGMLKPDENVELINGEVYTMTPIGSKHAAVVELMSDRLESTIDKKIKVRTQNPIHIDQWNEPQPDVVLLKYRQDYYASAHPVPADILLIVEVSDSSLDYDRNTKLPLYASAGIPDYWIIDLSGNCIEVYEEPMDDRYRKRTLYAPGNQITFMEKSFEVSEFLLIK